MVENMLELSLFKYSRKESTRSNVVGMRATYGLTTLTLKDLYPDLTIFSADTSTSAGLDRFKTSHSDSFFQINKWQRSSQNKDASHLDQQSNNKRISPARNLPRSRRNRL